MWIRWFNNFKPSTATFNFILWSSSPSKHVFSVLAWQGDFSHSIPSRPSELFTLHAVSNEILRLLWEGPRSIRSDDQNHRTLDAVLNDVDIELIVVGTPSGTHYSFAKAALQAGKHGVSFVGYMRRTRI